MTKPRLPTDPAERKKIPLAAVLNYFDLAFVEVAKVIYAGNKQHNPDSTTMVWDRSKSTDQDECLLRHFIERGTLDESDGLRHSAKIVWRALAALQLEMEEALQLPPSRASINASTPVRSEPTQLLLPFVDDKPFPSTSPINGEFADETTLVGFPTPPRT